jgi:hypothetical protein
MATRVIYWDAHRARGASCRLDRCAFQLFHMEQFAAEEDRRAKAGVRASELFAFSSTPDGVTHR